ncbi:hypothetical protein JOD64_002672 [Micromonospora luteifusca]|uniref:ABC transporter permease n=1 Tax=Micromonospora luteifusca TaxID=709860 RepID=A0ABS2LTD2_9ACTN|nr:hypothetical protein [Micromonospora luteifusca]MBM7491450.1 hypothetical protein [Micromonospora luteifusca]
MPEATAPEGKYLESLLVDYQQGRDEERHFSILQGTVLTLCLGALSLLGALVNEVAKGTKIASAVLVTAPLPVIAILAFLQAAGTMAVMRSFYLRALEREIRQRLGAVKDLAAYKGLKPFTYIELLNTYNSLSARGGRTSSFQQVMAVMVFVILCLVFGGLTIFLGLNVPLPWRLVMLLVYGAAAIAIFSETIRSNLGGRKIFKRYVEATASRLAKDLYPTEIGGKRAHLGRLGTYLALPRPDDLAKAIYVVMGAFFGWLAVSSNAGPPARAYGPSLPEIAMFVVGVELLVYQSRYQWNDIRGVYEDRSAPLAKARRRLAGDESTINTSVKYSLIIMLVRLYLVLWIISLHWSPAPRFSFSDQILLISIPAIYILAVLYEWVRARMRRSEESGTRDFRWLLLLVSLGYPLRFGLGWAAVGGPILSTNFVLAVIAFAGLGLGVVTLTWVLEGASYITSAVVDGPDRRYTAADAIRRKPHLLKLLEVSGARTRVQEPLAGHEVDGADLKLLQEVRWSMPSAWRLGAALWVLCISVAAGSLVGLPPLVPWQWGLIAAAAVLLPLHQRGGILPFLISGVVLLSGFSLTIASHWSGVAEGDLLLYQLLAVAVLCLIQPVFYLFFYASSYRDTRDGAYRLTEGIGKQAAEAGRWFIGARST